MVALRDNAASGYALRGVAIVVRLKGRGQNFQENQDMIRNTVTRGLCAVVALGIALPLAAAPKTASKPAASSTIWCPLMDQDIQKSKATKSTVNGKTYYFCCKKCKAMFDKDPKKQAAKYDAQVKAHSKKKA